MTRETFYVPQQLVPTRISTMLAEPSIYFNAPKLQRSAKTWPKRKKQAFIESVLFGIPLHSMILHHDADLRGDKLWMLDGLQRGTAIREYANGEFKTGRNRAGMPDFGCFEPNCTISQLSALALAQFRSYPIPLQIIETADPKIIKYVFEAVQYGTPLTLGERLYAQSYDNDSVLAIEQIEDHQFFSVMYRGENIHRETYMMAQFPLILEINGLFASLDAERLRNLAADAYREKITNEMLERIEENLFLAQHLFHGIRITAKNEVALMYQAVALLRFAGFNLFNAEEGALTKWYRENVPDKLLQGVKRQSFNTIISQHNKNASQEHFWQVRAVDVAAIPGLGGSARERENMERLAMWLHYRHFCPSPRCNKLVGNMKEMFYHQFLPTDKPCLSPAELKEVMSTRELVTV